MQIKTCKKHGGRIAIVFIVIFVGISLTWLNPLEKQQLYLSNFLYYERPTNNQVVVVSIDNEAVSSDGLGKFSSWCRTNYIPVLKKLAEYKPAVIGIDILFLNKSEGLCKDALNNVLNSDNPSEELIKYANTDHPDDIALGNALEEMDNVVMLTRVTPSDNENNIKLINDNYVKFPLKIFGGEIVASGHNRIQSDKSGLIRYIVPAYIYKNKQILSFSVNIIKKYLNLDSDTKSQIEQDYMIIEGKEKIIIPLEDFRMQINYNQKVDLKANTNGNILTIPFIDLIDNTKDFSNEIKGKIVLIGVRFSSSEDHYQTPIDPTNTLHGVMIHAQAIQTILDKAWLRNMNFIEQIGVIALLGILALAIVFFLRIWIALPFLALLIIIYEVLIAPIFFRKYGIILNMVYPPLTVIFAGICGYAYRYLFEFQQKHRVAGALSQYVNEEVAKNILKNENSQIGTGGKKREITVVFTDIKKFTTISEQLQPQSIVALLNEYFEIMTEIIIKNNGTVDKYEGDALMAFFENKTGLENHPIRAARSALEMRSALEKLNSKWKNSPPLPGGENYPKIDFRVGISTGEAVVGNIGSKHHLQYTAIGDIVNLGSRLESANKKYHTSIMLSDTSYEEVKDVYACRFLDLIRVRGRNKPLKVYELLASHKEISENQQKLISIYNHALTKYFERDFSGALDIFQKEIFTHWPADYLSNLYAGRCEFLMRFPPQQDWDFVYKLSENE